MKFKELLIMLPVVLLIVLGMPSCLSEMDEEGKKQLAIRSMSLPLPLMPMSRLSQSVIH